MLPLLITGKPSFAPAPCQSGLKLYQSELLNPVQNPFSSPEKSACHQVFYRSSQDQNLQNSADNTILGAIFVLVGLPIPFNIFTSQSKNQGKHYLCSLSFNKSPQDPEISFDCPGTSLCYLSSDNMKNKSR